MTIVFLDFDGPFLNFRCAYNPTVPMLDRTMVDVINRWLDVDSTLTLVISATARTHFESAADAQQHLESWGVQSAGRVHPDFSTTSRRTLRHLEIDEWFLRNSGVDPSTAWVLDDEKPPLQPWGGPSQACRWIPCDVYDGFTWHAMQTSGLWRVLR